MGGCSWWYVLVEISAQLLWEAPVTAAATFSTFTAGYTHHLQEYTLTARGCAGLWWLVAGFVARAGSHSTNRSWAIVVFDVQHFNDSMSPANLLWYLRTRSWPAPTTSTHGTARHGCGCAMAAYPQRGHGVHSSCCPTWPSVYTVSHTNWDAGCHTESSNHHIIFARTSTLTHPVCVTRRASHVRNVAIPTRAASALRSTCID